MFNLEYLGSFKKYTPDSGDYQFPLYGTCALICLRSMWHPQMASDYRVNIFLAPLLEGSVDGGDCACFISMKYMLYISSYLSGKTCSHHAEYPGGIQKGTQRSSPHSPEPNTSAVSL